MPSDLPKRLPDVGPVLAAGPLADAVVAAIRSENPDVTVEDRGSYLRVRAPGTCHVTLAAITRQLGHRIEIPTDLEAIMPSFLGHIAFDDESVTWSRRERRR